MLEDSPALLTGQSCQSEFARKVLHLGALVVPISYYVLPTAAAIALIAVAFVISLLVDVARIRRWPIHDLWSSMLAPILRPGETSAFSGATYILLSGWLCPVLYERSAAALGMTAIILGDSAAALVGRRWGRHRYMRSDRSWEGSAAFFCAAVIGALTIPGLPMWIGVGCCILATIVEAFSDRIDDNLLVPVTTGLVATLLLRSLV